MVLNKGTNINKIIRGTFKLLKGVKQKHLIVLWEKKYIKILTMERSIIYSERSRKDGDESRMMQDTLCLNRIYKLCRKFNTIFTPMFFKQYKKHASFLKCRHS